MLFLVFSSPIAARAQIRLGPPLFVPNGQIGSFGSVSQIKSLVGSRSDLFDYAFSGPAAAGALSALLFLVGLGLSTSGLPKAGSASVPPIHVPRADHAVYYPSYLLDSGAWHALILAQLFAKDAVPVSCASSGLHVDLRRCSPSDHISGRNRFSCQAVPARRRSCCRCRRSCSTAACCWARWRAPG